MRLKSKLVIPNEEARAGAPSVAHVVREARLLHDATGALAKVGIQRKDRPQDALPSAFRTHISLGPG
jgi:hypothetical protein